MKAARYYPDSNPKIFSPLNVKTENDDGTVDLVNGKGVLVVGSCPVSDEPKEGHCVILKEEAPKDTKPKK